MIEAWNYEGLFEKFSLRSTFSGLVLVLFLNFKDSAGTWVRFSFMDENWLFKTGHLGIFLYPRHWWTEGLKNNGKVKENYGGSLCIYIYTVMPSSMDCCSIQIYRLQHVP